jgi:hypothetical protein
MISSDLKLKRRRGSAPHRIKNKLKSKMPMLRVILMLIVSSMD